jgi:hypothetical protein
MHRLWSRRHRALQLYSLADRENRQLLALLGVR